MSFDTPPELGLRQAIRRNVGHGDAEVTSTSGLSTYRAMVCTQHKKPLALKQLPSKETIPKGYVRVQVRYSGINFADILASQGTYQEKTHPPFTPGMEMSGVITEVGPGVTDYNIGDHVIGLAPRKFGGFSEEAIIPVRSLVHVDSGVPFDLAAGTVATYGTAYMALKRRANIQEGETVLVTAAAGGVGLACVDLAAIVFKCKVIGACGGSEKCEIVKQYGAVAAIDYNTESVKDRVKELTNGRGADIIFEMVGGKIGDECTRCIAFEGRLLVIGFASGSIPKIQSNHLLVKSCSAIGMNYGSYLYLNPQAFSESVQAVAGYLARGAIRPHISKEFPLAQANEAFGYVLSRKSTGKVVINTQV